jgi:phage terminase large subunit
MIVPWGDYVLPKFREPWHSRKRFVVCKGGAGGGKSVFACQKILERSLTNERARFICTRKYKTTVRKSVWKMLKIFARDYGVFNEFDWQEYSMTATAKRSGAEIICDGLDDVEKIKSVPNITGFWHEEPTELAPCDLDQCDLRLRGANHYFQHILTFNPISETNWIKARFYDQVEPDALLHHSTYKDNPHNGPLYHPRMEWYRVNNPDYYKVYGLGDWGVLRGLIYRIWPDADWPVAPDDTIYGLDFGYSHPTALIEIAIDGGNYHVRERIYKEGLTDRDIVEYMADENISKNAPIYADAAQPGTIRLIQESGYNVWEADKTQNSVLTGIMRLRGLPIFVDPNSSEIKRENRSYKWRERKDGVILQEPEKKDDHALDAIRYAIHTHLGTRIEVCTN